MAHMYSPWVYMIIYYIRDSPDGHSPTKRGAVNLGHDEDERPTAEPRTLLTYLYLRVSRIAD